VERVFLDYNATNSVNSVVWNALSQLEPIPVNPSSVHAFGQKAKQAVSQSSEKLATLLKVHPLDLIFVSGGTEANHLGVLGHLPLLNNQKDQGVIYFSCSGHASLAKLKGKCEALGFTTAFLPVESLKIPTLDLMHAKREFEKRKPLLVAWEWANNECGVIQPMDAIYDLAKQFGSAMHVDAVQSFGRIPTDLSKFPLASFAFTGHKYGGLGGHGLLVKPNTVHLSPLMVGGSQQNNLRAGTLSIPLIKAQEVCMLHYAESQARRFEHCLMLRTQLESSLELLFKSEHPGEIFAKDVERLPNTTFFRCIGINAETLMMAMDLKGFMISTGSACSSGSIDPSAMLLQMGMDGVAAAEFVRISTSESITSKQIEKFIRELKAFIKTCH
jgi:cysteine desulfurase